MYNVRRARLCWETSAFFPTSWHLFPVPPWGGSGIRHGILDVADSVSPVRSRRGMAARGTLADSPAVSPSPRLVMGVSPGGDRSPSLSTLHPAWISSSCLLPSPPPPLPERFDNHFRADPLWQPFYFLPLFPLSSAGASAHLFARFCLDFSLHAVLFFFSFALCLGRLFLPLLDCFSPIPILRALRKHRCLLRGSVDS